MFLPHDLVTISITPTLDTSIYASGDVLFVPNKLSSATLETKSGSYLRSVLTLDQADQKAAIDLLFFNQDPGSIGAANAALNMSNAQLAMLVGILSIATGDYAQMKAATNAAAITKAVDLPLIAMQASKDIWVAGVSRGTPTYAASDLTLKFNLERH